MLVPQLYSQHDPEPVWVVLCWKWHSHKNSLCWSHGIGLVSTKGKLGQTKLHRGENGRQTHYYGSTILAILLQQEGKSEQQKNKPDKTKHILKAFKTYFSYLSRRALCYLFLKILKLRVIIPAEVAAQWPNEISARRPSLNAFQLAKSPISSCYCKNYKQFNRPFFGRRFYCELGSRCHIFVIKCEQTYSLRLLSLPLSPVFFLSSPLQEVGGLFDVTTVVDK